METVLSVRPRELTFEVGVGAPIVTKLALESKLDEELAFKVKTTHPRRYVVRPNAGVLKPREAIAIEIAMETVTELPPDMAACKDKFLLQVSKTAGRETLPSSEFWATVPPEKVIQQKFKVFLTTASPANPPA
eukprot:CAMPEP_0198346630 /NCGR_PEP_ID=MMETSP1450-20131203/80770_1 /TAXON_ID=753684 ORGANISM="Madagascaria erythrocladiodes, Strain CCMP3234" /NCGR_SAMPLE_ID=MMETSP1450 /ASSEMBLY_ACC=CAM_ASM_001115 /LENGTH=132 /DNA_ID=CAMNT_0044052089 /DNA_START=164 /DNA_END=558 /DNA_ORIENTATION=-